MTDTMPTMTTAQMQAMMTPQMLAMMTPAHQAQMQAMTQMSVEAWKNTAQRLPTDANGKSFTRNAACVVQQPPKGLVQSIPTALVGASVSVISTSGERVRVRYPNGEERDFHKTELGVQ